jgi:hypothetical protein
MACASDAGTRRGRRGGTYCAGRRVRLSMAWHDTFLQAPVAAGAFLFRRELLLSLPVQAVRASVAADIGFQRSKTGGSARPRSQASTADPPRAAHSVLAEHGLCPLHLTPSLSGACMALWRPPVVRQKFEINEGPAWSVRGANVRLGGAPTSCKAAPWECRPSADGAEREPRLGNRASRRPPG